MASEASKRVKRFPRRLLLNFRKGKKISLFSVKNEDIQCSVRRSAVSNYELNATANNLPLEACIIGIPVKTEITQNISQECQVSLNRTNDNESQLLGQCSSLRVQRNELGGTMSASTDSGIDCGLSISERNSPEQFETFAQQESEKIRHEKTQDINEYALETLTEVDSAKGSSENESENNEKSFKITVQNDTISNQSRDTLHNKDDTAQSVLNGESQGIKECSITDEQDVNSNDDLIIDALVIPTDSDVSESTLLLDTIANLTAPNICETTSVSSIGKSTNAVKRHDDNTCWKHVDNTSRKFKYSTNENNVGIGDFVFFAPSDTNISLGTNSASNATLRSLLRSNIHMSTDNEDANSSTANEDVLSTSNKGNDDNDTHKVLDNIFKDLYANQTDEIKTEEAQLRREKIVISTQARKNFTAIVSVSQQIVNPLPVLSTSVATHRSIPSTASQTRLFVNDNSAFAKCKTLKSSVSDVKKGILGKFRYRNKENESGKAKGVAKSKLTDSSQLASLKVKKLSKWKEKNMGKTQYRIEQNSGDRKCEKNKNSGNSFTKKEKTKISPTNSKIPNCESIPIKLSLETSARTSPVVQEILSNTEKEAIKSNSLNCFSFQPEPIQDLTACICQMTTTLCASRFCICDCKNTSSATTCCQKRTIPSSYQVVPEAVTDKILRCKSTCYNRKSPLQCSRSGTLKDTHISDNKNDCYLLSVKENRFDSNISSSEGGCIGRYYDYCDGSEDCCDESTGNCQSCHEDNSECSDLYCSWCCQTGTCFDEISVSSSDICSDSDSKTSESVNDICDKVLENGSGKCISNSCASRSSFSAESDDSVDINVSPYSVSFRELDVKNEDVMFVDCSISDQFKNSYSLQTLLQNRRYASQCATPASSPVQNIGSRKHNSMTVHKRMASLLVDHFENPDLCQEINCKDSITKAKTCRKRPCVSTEMSPYHSCQCIKGSPDDVGQSADSTPTPLNLSQNSSFTNISLDGISTNSADNSPTQNHDMSPVCSHAHFTGHNGSIHINRPHSVIATSNRKCYSTNILNSSKLKNLCPNIDNWNNSVSSHNSSLFSETSHNHSNYVNSTFAGNKSKANTTNLNRSDSFIQYPKRTFSRSEPQYASFHGKFSSPTSPLDLSLNKTNKSLASPAGRTGNWMEHVGQLFSPAKRVLHKNQGLTETDLCKQILDLYVSDAEESRFEASSGAENFDSASSSLSRSFSEQAHIFELGSHVEDSILQYGTYVGPKNVAHAGPKNMEIETNVDDFTTTMVWSCYSGQAKTRRLQGGPNNDLVQGEEKCCSTVAETHKLKRQKRRESCGGKKIDNHQCTVVVLVSNNEDMHVDVSRQALRGRTNTSQMLSDIAPSEGSSRSVQQNSDVEEIEDQIELYDDEEEIEDQIKLHDSNVCDNSFDCLTVLHTACNGEKRVRYLSSAEVQNISKSLPPPKEATRISWGQTLNEIDLYRHSPHKTPVKTRPILTQKENHYPYADDTPSPIFLTKLRKPRPLSNKYQNWPWSK